MDDQRHVALLYDPWNPAPRALLQTLIGALLGGYPDESAFHRFHRRQLACFEALWIGAGMLTCGASMVLGFPFFLVALDRARAAAKRGQCVSLPLVGRWVPPPEPP